MERSEESISCLDLNLSFPAPQYIMDSHSIFNILILTKQDDSFLFLYYISSETPLYALGRLSMNPNPNELRTPTKPNYLLSYDGE